MNIQSLKVQSGKASRSGKVRGRTGVGVRQENQSHEKKKKKARETMERKGSAWGRESFDGSAERGKKKKRMKKKPR